MMRRLITACSAVLTLFAAQLLASPNPAPVMAQTPLPHTSPAANPCPNNPAGVPCTPMPTLPPNVTPPPARPCPPSITHVVPCPDLTAKRPVSVGGRPTVWGAGVTLMDGNRIPGSSAMCAFDIIYTIANIGTANAGPPGTFKDVLRVDGSPVSIQTLLTLAAGASQVIHTQAYLPAGVHKLTLDVNDGHAIAESNYANNHFEIKYQLTGKCASQP